MMRGLKSRVHPVTVVLTLVVVGFAIFMLYGRKLEQQTPSGPVLPRGMDRPLPQPAYDEALGALLTVSIDPPGDKIVAFRPRRDASVLGVLGLYPGDIVVNINGQGLTAGTVQEAMDALKKDGTPITIELYRNGQKMELKYTELPTEAPPAPPGMGPPGDK